MTYTYTFSLCTFLLLAGCASTTPAPVYVTGVTPELPKECFPREVAAPKEPKLAANQDATDIDAVRDREQWKRAYRTVNSYRATCGQRLDVLFPQSEKGKPTS